MSKTIKQIAEELGVSKQAVHQKRKSKELSSTLQPFTSTVDGVVYISVEGENLIKQAFLKKDRKRVDDEFTPKVDGSFTPLENSEIIFLRGQIEKLQTELEKEREHNREKDKQLLETLNKLAESQAALSAGQAADKQKALAEKIIEGKKQMVDREQEEVVSQGFFAKFFSRKKFL
ncbi:MAG: hypothetical protein K5768_10725 [Firmicutes bacterium]|nr:hypothetical protein [Bacillota bacterium]